MSEAPIIRHWNADLSLLKNFHHEVGVLIFKKLAKFLLCFIGHQLISLVFKRLAQLYNGTSTAHSTAWA